MSKRHLSADKQYVRPTKSARHEEEAADVNNSSQQTEEGRRLASIDNRQPWRLWGPYLSDRHWGTVREDHSVDGSCWDYVTHDDATYCAYESGEDGLLGICDEFGELCLALALWNGHDHILKERLFGLAGPQGNHGEDVKELYYFQDSTPTHSYMRSLYKYPQTKFPYDALLSENATRGKDEPEYELLDTGVLDNRFWDITAEYAKANPQDILCRYTVHNRGSESATIHVLPTLWYRNTWSSAGHDDQSKKKQLRLSPGTTNEVLCSGSSLGDYVFIVDNSLHETDIIFTENETNIKKFRSKHKIIDEKDDDYLCNQPSSTIYSKDAFHSYIIQGNKKSVNPNLTGTKCAAVYCVTVQPGSQTTINCRLFHKDVISGSTALFGKRFNETFNLRRRESDEFYQTIIPQSLTADMSSIARQAYAGLCWSKQLYIYNGRKMLRKDGRHAWNPSWKHLDCRDVISMPDKWEFPWFATWDLAFHMLPMSDIDLQFAKSQLLLFLCDRYQHPNGQLPAYEFDYSDVNPPVHAWACLHVYNKSNVRDTQFLLKCFHRLAANFTWWLNAKDPKGTCMFNAGFLGMDNISCVDRSRPPQGTTVDQVDGSAWMAFYALCMMRIAVELSVSMTEGKQLYEEMAITYLGHFTRISQALNDEKTGLWDNDDNFFYDRLNILSNGDQQSRSVSLRVRSLVGLSTMFATCIIPHDALQQLPALRTMLNANHFGRHQTSFKGGILLSLVNQHQLIGLLRYLLDDREFLSPFGIRSLSKYHEKNDFTVTVNNQDYSVTYCPAESNSDLFGGNSNWRGPVWVCMNYLLIEAIDIYSAVWNDLITGLLPNLPVTLLSEVSRDLRQRLVSIFSKSEVTSLRPVNGDSTVHENSILFHEYINPETGGGCGASHQTGWTALVASIVQHLAGEHC